MDRCFYRNAKNLPWALRAHVNGSFSRSTTNELLQMNYYKWLYCKRSFVEWLWENGPSALGARSATTTKSTFSGSFPGYPTKNGGKISIFNDRRKRFSERPEKVHFWKIHFQNLLQKSKNSNFAAIFVYIEYMNEFWFCWKWYQQMEAQKIFLRSDPSGPRSRITTNYTINRLICNRIDDSLL